MLKLFTLAACVIAFVFLGPKAWAEFRQARPQPRTRVSNNAEHKDTPKKPRSSRRLTSKHIPSQRPSKSRHLTRRSEGS
jgi:hypothetical protein